MQLRAPSYMMKAVRILTLRGLETNFSQKQSLDGFFLVDCKHNWHSHCSAKLRANSELDLKELDWFGLGDKDERQASGDVFQSFDKCSSDPLGGTGLLVKRIS